MLPGKQCPRNCYPECIALVACSSAMARKVNAISTACSPGILSRELLPGMHAYTQQYSWDSWSPFCHLECWHLLSESYRSKHAFPGTPWENEWKPAVHCPAVLMHPKTISVRWTPGYHAWLPGLCALVVGARNAFLCPTE